MGVILLENERGLTLHLIFLSCHIRDSLSGCETWIQIIHKLRKARCDPFPGWRGTSHWRTSSEGYKGGNRKGRSALGYSAPWDFSACSGHTEVTVSLCLDLPLWGGGRWQLWSYSNLKETPDSCDAGSYVNWHFRVVWCWIWFLKRSHKCHSCNHFRYARPPLHGCGLWTDGREFFICVG